MFVFESSSTQTVILLWLPLFHLPLLNQKTTPFILWWASEYIVHVWICSAMNWNQAIIMMSLNWDKGNVFMHEVVTISGVQRVMSRSGDLQRRKQVIQYNGLKSSDTSIQENQLQKSDRKVCSPRKTGECMEKENLHYKERIRQWFRRKAASLT